MYDIIMPCMYVYYGGIPSYIEANVCFHDEISHPLTCKLWQNIDDLRTWLTSNFLIEQGHL